MALSSYIVKFYRQVELDRDKDYHRFVECFASRFISKVSNDKSNIVLIFAYATTDDNEGCFVDDEEFQDYINQSH